jgi:hypothetical protein
MDSIGMAPPNQRRPDAQADPPHRPTAASVRVRQRAPRYPSESPPANRTPENTRSNRSRTPPPVDSSTPQHKAYRL